MKLMHLNDLDYGDEKSLLAKFKNFADKCRIEPGLFNRWPDGGGGSTSHDELMGIAYLSRSLAKEIVVYLLEHDGVYNNQKADTGIHDYLNKHIALKEFLIGDQRYNLYRFPWLMPYLKASAGININLASKLIFAAHVTWDALCYNPNKSFDAGGRLRMWLMMETMSQYTACHLAFLFWQSKMTKAKVNPRMCFETEPAEFPIYAASAPEKFY